MPTANSNQWIITTHHCTISCLVLKKLQTIFICPGGSGYVASKCRPGKEMGSIFPARGRARFNLLLSSLGRSRRAQTFPVAIDVHLRPCYPQPVWAELLIGSERGCSPVRHGSDSRSPSADQATVGNASPCAASLIDATSPIPRAHSHCSSA